MIKKLFFLLIAFIATINTNAQSFSMEEFNNDMKTWNDIAANYKSKTSNKKWAREAAKTFKLNDDGVIKTQYVFTADGTFDKKEMNRKINEFIKLNYQNVEPIADTDSLITFNFFHKNIANFVGFVTVTHISAKKQTAIEIKDNRIRVTITFYHYTLWSGNQYGTIQNGIIAPINSYPFNEKSDHKESYSQAYINTMSKTLNDINNLINYLNKKDGITINDNNW